MLLISNSDLIQPNIDCRCGFWCITLLYDHWCRFEKVKKCQKLASPKLASVVTQKCYAPKSTSTISFELNEIRITIQKL